MPKFDDSVHLVQFGVNTPAEIKPGSSWWVLLEDFCRDLLADLGSKLVTQ